ncbi:MAG: hypothetical protein HC923_10695 [Myxococcales bacterium]|nr:hypothetical protein [Myxococcales bacterium]
MQALVDHEQAPRSVAAILARMARAPSRRSGEWISVTTSEARDALPSGTVVLSEREEKPPDLPSGSVPRSVDVDRRRAADREMAERVLSGLGEEERKIVHCLRDGAELVDLPAALGVGPHRVHKHQFRLFRAVERQLRRVGSRAGPYRTIHAVIAPDDDQRLDPCSRERLVKHILRRLHPEPARPFQERLGWALGVSLLAVVATIMVLMLGEA